jgi:hypothetical protein
VNIHKITYWGLVALDIWMNLEQSDILTSNLPIHEHGIYLHSLSSSVYYFQFCGFHFIAIIHIFLDLYLSTSFLG